MTTGSVNFSSPGVTGVATCKGGQTYWVKTWTGGDRPRVERPPRPSPYPINLLVGYNRKGEPRFREVLLRQPWDKPKRSVDLPHAYSMNATYATNSSFALQRAFCSGNTDPYVGDDALGQFGSPFWAPENLLNDNDHIELVNRLREKSNGSEFNLAVFLAEGSEALSMIADSATRVAKAIGSLRSGKISKAWRALVQGTPRHGLKQPKVASRHDVASQWLQLQYGWLPLLGDAKASAECVAHILTDPPAVVCRASVSKRQTHVRDLLRPSGCQDGVQLYVHGTAAGVKTHRRSIVARFKDEPTMTEILGLQDPALVLWEKMPFSFVADWFVPIGDYLSARAFASRISGTFVITDKMQGFQATPLLEGLNFTHVDPFVMKTIMTRTVTTTLEVPTPQFKGLEKAGTFGHAVNALALVTSIFR